MATSSLRVVMTKSTAQIAIKKINVGDLPSVKRQVTVEILQSRPSLSAELLSLDTDMAHPISHLSAKGVSKQLFVMFTGNPGMVSFYDEFARILKHHAEEGDRVGVPFDSSLQTNEETLCGEGHLGSSSGAAANDPIGVQNTNNNAPNESFVESDSPFYKSASRMELDVLVIGYAGHSSEELNNGNVFVLEDQEGMALGAMEKIMSRVGDSNYTKVYVGGHSIGAHVATVVCDAHRDSPILSRAFFLAPTLCRMRESPEGLSKGPLMNSKLKSESAIFLSSSLRGILPKSYLLWLVEKGEPKCTRESVAATTVVDVMRGNVLRNVLAMAKSELENVYDLDVDRLQRIRNKVVAWFPKDDHWSPLEFYREIAAALGVTSFTDEEIIAGSSARKWFIGKEEVRLNSSRSEEADTVKNDGDMGKTVAGPPICAVDTSDEFVHAWCLGYNKDLILRAILPYMEMHQRSAFERAK